MVLGVEVEDKVRETEGNLREKWETETPTWPPKGAQPRGSCGRQMRSALAASPCCAP